MSEQEIKDLEAVAIFMDGIRQPNSYNHELTEKIFGRPKHWLIPHFGYFDTEYLKYHYSWDWLIPVVEKIESIEKPRKDNPSYNYTPFRVDQINRNMVEILEDGEISRSFVGEENLTKIQALYKAIVNFIHWYNENKS